MRNLSTTVLAIALFALSASSVEATPIITVDLATTTGGLDRYTFAINNASGDVYDTIDVTILADPGKEFVRTFSNACFGPGCEKDTAFLGNTVAKGLALVGIEVSDTRLSGVITTFGGARTDGLNDDFAQVVGAPGLSGSYTFNFALAGVQVLGSVQGVYGIPEPSTFLLAGIGLIGLASHRRS